jgi:ketosteroid isomerase-like protein
MNNIELIHRFYQAFAQADAEGMVSCYHTNIQFEDPAFGVLRGEDARNMWRMLIASSKGNIKITFDNVQANETSGSATWVAEYVFSQTNRPVINHISATFLFQDGKIIKHTDVFDMWKWSRQALGWKGWLLGWSPFMKKQIQANTHKLLKKFRDKQTQ